MDSEPVPAEPSRWWMLRERFGRLRKLLESFLFPVLILSLILAIVFAVPEQFLELYRIMAGNVVFAFQTEGDSITWQRTLAIYSSQFLAPFLSLSVLTIALALSARIIEILGRGPQRPDDAFWHRLYNFAPLAVGILPVIGCVIGILLARSSSAQRDISGEAELLAKLGDVTLANTHLRFIDFAQKADMVLNCMAVFLIVGGGIFILAGFLINRRKAVEKSVRELAENGVLSFISFTSFIILIGAAVLALLSFPVALPKMLGVFGTIAAFGSVLAIFSAFLMVQSHRIGFPFIGFLIFLALAFAILDLNDNHQLRYLKAGKDHYPIASEIATVKPLPEVKENFLIWLKNRDGITFEEPSVGNENGTWTTSSGKKFPVYIVAAQGGGMYAAAQANMFLTQTTATCEQFPQHIFAISSVSGGSVGVAAYNAALTKFGRKHADCLPFKKIAKPNKDTFSPAALSALRATYEMAAEDWFSPLVGAALFPDFAQRFWFRPMPSLSRARALEVAIEKSWEQHYLGAAEKDNPLKRGIVASWDPKGIRPALLLNTTESGSGRRRVIAPFKFAVPARSDLQFLPVSKELDVSLSAAAVASARFPYVTPAAWFWPARGHYPSKTASESYDVQNSRIRIVDGGYFENSGVATASDLVARLEEIASIYRLPIEIHMIVLTYGRYPERKLYAFGEFLAPIRSLLNARESRTMSTIALADRDMGSVENAAPVRRLQRVTLTDFYTPLPLGWRLSSIGVLQIRRGMSRIPYCFPNPAFVQDANVPALGDGNCVARLIWHQLRGDDIRKAREQACQQAEARSENAGGNFKCKPVKSPTR